MPRRIIVSGTGCCLVDMLYTNINFMGDAIRPYLSKQRGDGGLAPGKLVFQEEFEKFSGISLDSFINRLTGSKGYDKINIGGPSIVSLINAAQITGREKCEVRFFGRAGNDANGHFLLDSLKKTPVVLKDFRLVEDRTPSTLVLSDPAYENGHGERMFINSIGAAWRYHAGDLDEDFFCSDIAVFGGTALVPNIHDNLTALLEKAKKRGCKTIVNTVFDFRNEKANPAERWPLGGNGAGYGFIDLLITDKEEALRLSGENIVEEALRFFIGKNVSSVVITNGANNITAFSDGLFFCQSPVITMPVSQRIKDEIINITDGDTTGCGDNFAGGMISSVVSQLERGIRHPDLKEACAWGVASGGFSCFYIGGTFFEKYPGEKLALIRPYYEAYRKQISC